MKHIDNFQNFLNESLDNGENPILVLNKEAKKWKIAEISKNKATQADAKKLYRKLVMNLHPDRHKNLSEKEIDDFKNRFSKISHAYELIDKDGIDSWRSKVYTKKGGSGSSYNYDNMYDNFKDITAEELDNLFSSVNNSFSDAMERLKKKSKVAKVLLSKVITSLFRFMIRDKSTLRSLFGRGPKEDIPLLNSKNNEDWKDKITSKKEGNLKVSGTFNVYRSLEAAIKAIKFNVNKLSDGNLSVSINYGNQLIDPVIKEMTPSQFAKYLDFLTISIFISTSFTEMMLKVYKFNQKIIDSYFPTLQQRIFIDFLVRSNLASTQKSISQAIKTGVFRYKYSNSLEMVFKFKPSIPDVEVTVTRLGTFRNRKKTFMLGSRGANGFIYNLMGAINKTYRI
jgi:curved DNA-binding protein CbpA